MLQTQEQLIRELMDREAIRGLAIRYANANWEGNTDAMAELFTEDGEMSSLDPVPGIDPKPKKGIPELKRTFAAGVVALDHPVPLIHNHEIKLLSPDEATGIVFSEVRSANRNMAMVAIGSYEDRYRKVAGQWKFARRVTRLYWFHQ